MEKTSKLLSSILRHRAEKLKLNVRPDGYVDIDELLALREMKHVTKETIVKIVETDSKQRYSIKDNMIRANQGHSIKAIESEELLEEIKDPSLWPHCIHGTTREAWKRIETQGLNRMKRKHIHFCSQPFRSTEIISGMRNTSQVLIHVDVAKAMKDGIRFFVSENKVILTEGVGGILPSSYFAKVEFVAE